ncbi:MAG: hypothetical protein R3B53_03880 [Candidatus Paceibacterota bacterium]
MKSLAMLIVQNQSNLDRLRSRLRYSRTILRKEVLNEHQQYGPYANYWEEWTTQAEFLLEELTSDIASTVIFIKELKDFLHNYEKDECPTKEHQKSYVAMQKLAIEALAWQKDMIKITDEKISLHREFTHKLLLVEAIDSIDED